MCRIGTLRCEEKYCFKIILLQPLFIFQSQGIVIKNPLFADMYIGVNMYLLNSPPLPKKKKWPNKLLEKKYDHKENSKGKKCIFFPQVAKSMHIFPLINLHLTKLKVSKRLICFTCGAHHAPTTFCCGKKYKPSNLGERQKCAFQRTTNLSNHNVKHELEKQGILREL